MKKERCLVAPSVLSANFLHLSEELTTIETGGVDWIHFDVMDGDFVPNLTFGPKILADITHQSGLFIDCHLMVKIKRGTVAEYLTPFVEAKAHSITLHYEALTLGQWEEFVAFKKAHQIKIGLSIKPGTNVQVLDKFLPDLDVVLVMSVEPGFGGQKFIPGAVDKIAYLRKMIDQQGLTTLIEVDGGINQQTAELCLAAGADVLVAGSYLFGQSDIVDRIAGLKYGA